MENEQIFGGDEPIEIEGRHSIYNESGRFVPMRALHDRVEKLYRWIGQAESEVSIVVMTDDAIRALNKEWRHVDSATDVLSFPMREGEDAETAASLPLGDVAISLDTAERYVASCHHKERLDAQGDAPLTETWSLLDELTFLIIHSTLHLLGFDHAEPEEDRVMRAREREWMQAVLELEMSKEG